MISIFYFLSFLAIISAFMVVIAKNPIHSVLYLIMAFFAIAGHYVLLNAQFLAVVNIIVYAGAIMVLFLFVIMLLNLNTDAEQNKSALIRLIGIVAGGIMMITLIGAFKQAHIVQDSSFFASGKLYDIGLVKNLGNTLFKDFLVPFELSSILFLAAMVGAVMLGKKDIKG